MRALAVAALMAAVAGCPLFGQDTAEPKAGDARVQKWIADLEHREWRVREEACRRLVAAGKVALPAILQAIGSAGPESRWRLEQLQLAIDPLAAYRPVLQLVADGKVEAAITRLRYLAPRLPKETRPRPVWVLEILEQMRDERFGSSGITYLNVFLLLREAGIYSDRIRLKAIAAFDSDGDARSLRLKGVLMLHRPGEKYPPSKEAVKAATVWWDKGIKAAGAQSQRFYLEYEIAMWNAHLGKRDLAMQHLSKAAKASATHKQEAAKSADFYMLVPDREFRELIFDEKPKGAKKPVGKKPAVKKPKKRR